MWYTMLGLFWKIYCLRIIQLGADSYSSHAPAKASAQESAQYHYDTLFTCGQSL